MFGHLWLKETENTQFFSVASEELIHLKKHQVSSYFVRNAANTSYKGQNMVFIGVWLNKPLLGLNFSAPK